MIEAIEVAIGLFGIAEEAQGDPAGKKLAVRHADAGLCAMAGRDAVGHVGLSFAQRLACGPVLDPPPVVGRFFGDRRCRIEEFDGAVVDAAAQAPARTLMQEPRIVTQFGRYPFNRGVHPRLHLGQPQACFREALVSLADPRGH